jgi:hypothetical protein
MTAAVVRVQCAFARQFSLTEGVKQELLNVTVHLNERV